MNIRIHVSRVYAKRGWDRKMVKIADQGKNKEAAKRK